MLTEHVEIETGRELLYAESGETFVQLLQNLCIRPVSIQLNADSMIILHDDQMTEFAIFVDQIPCNEPPINIYDQEEESD